MLAVIINGGKQFSDINPNSETEPSASKHGELSLVAGWRLHPPEGWIMVRGDRSWTGWTQAGCWPGEAGTFYPEL